MTRVCVVHGRTKSTNWRITTKGYSCERCFSPQKIRPGFLSSNSYRVKKDQLAHEKELTQPYLGNKPNPEFLRAYPDQAKHFYTDKELKDFGATKIKSTKGDRFKGKDREQV